MNRNNIAIIGSLIILGFGGYFVFTYYRRKKIYENPVSYDEALKLLEEAKSN